MADKTGIEWADATWNPIVGCSIVSPGCTNCYAMKMAARIEAMHNGAAAEEPKAIRRADTHYAGTTQPSKAGPVWTGKLALAPESILTQPLRWKKPRTIFVNSMGDLFHESALDESIAHVFAIMTLAHQHTFLVLTKRAERMKAWFDNPRLNDLLGAAVLAAGYDGPLESLRWPLHNVWLGVSTERQAEADARIPLLLATPAAKRFISAEPLLGPIDLNRIHEHGEFESGASWHSWESALNGKRFDVWGDGPDIEGCPKLDWVIAGGESGKDARPMHPDWARGLRDQCVAAGIPFFFKQHGEWIAIRDVAESDDLYHPAPDRHPEASRRCKVETTIMKSDGSTCGPADPGAFLVGTGSHQIFRVGKARAGRLLDGIEHSERPQP